MDELLKPAMLLIKTTNYYGCIRHKYFGFKFL
jgi:hypothetical protein